MSLDLNAPAPLVIPQRRRPRVLPLLVLIVLLAAAIGAWSAGYRPAQFLALGAKRELETFEIDRGDVVIYVTENGTLESANNATVRSQVEALIGQVGGAAGAGGAAGRGGAGGQGGAGGRGGAQGAGGQPGQGGQPPQAQTKAAMPKGRPGARKPAGNAAAKKSSSATANNTATATGSGAATTASSSAPAGGAAASSSSGGGGGGGGGKGGGGGGGAAAAPVTNGTAVAAAAAAKPVIRSFTYMVQPHVPLRPKAVAVVQPKQQPVDPAAMGGGGGRRGGGGGGGGNQTEKPGATRIISILPEGTHVEAGDVVCELDSAALKDELQAQNIRHLQAKAWVEQAQAILEVNEITLKEYRDGIYPQDIQLISQHLKGCEIELERAKRNLDWSTDLKTKGMRATAQYNADKLAVQQAKMSLQEAKGMKIRLETYTGPKLIKSLEAKNQAIKADKFAQEEAFQKEDDRKRKLELMVERCTLRAPREGIVVYANTSTRSGRPLDQIMEGVTVRETQPIFNLPDPKHMQVKATINETKLAFVREGLAALIHVDALPGRTLRGTVAEITPIPAPANGFGSDVRIYYAVVKIEGEGLDELRPGMSAEVDIHLETHHDVTRVPLQAVREVQGQSYVAVPTPAQSSDEGPRWRWLPVTIGASDQTFAEVLDGLKPGERVIADPTIFPAPAPVKSTRTTVARAGFGDER